MNFLMYYERANTPQNELEIEVHEYLEAGNRLPIKEKDFPRLQHAMIDHIKALNDKYRASNYKPVSITFQFLLEGDVAVYIGEETASIFQATFLKFMDQ